jgi:hypothetical protein
MKNKGLNRQGSLVVLALLAIAVAVAVLVPRLWPQAVQACTEYTRAFSENFDTVNYKDIAFSSVAHWPSGPITLPPLGSNFVVSSPDSLGRLIYQCAAGDFTGDGYPDLIGLDFTDDPVSSELRLIENIYPTNHGARPLFSIDMGSSYDHFDNHTGPASITVGDYNGDGLLDFFYMRNSVDEFGYTNFRAAMYVNQGTAEVPSFQPYNVSPSLDFTARFQAAGIYIYWAANHLCSVDLDRDGDMDILVISQDRIFLLRNPGAGNFALANWAIGELPYDARTGYLGVPGGSAVSAADFDGDGDIDVVCGSVGTVPFLVYYENDGTGHFTRAEIAIPDATCVGVVGIMANDFTGDGRADIFVATDAAYRNMLAAGTAQARIWFLRNRGLLASGDVDWLFQCLNNCTSPTPAPYFDIDMAAPLDYDQDGDMDAVIADANHAGDYFYLENQLADVFELYGQAQSTNIAAGLLDPRLHAITRVRISSFRQGVLNGSSAGLAVQVLFSNNGGQDWEIYRTFSGAQIVNAADLPWYDFHNFGADLRWRIVLTAEEDLMADYQNASFETPYVDDLSLEFIYVDRREYSRASAAATIVTESGLSTKLVIGSSFIFPGWEGQLRAYDMTGVAFVAGSTSELQTIATSNLNDATGRDLIPGAGIYWDAGQLLNDRDPATRTIYTALRPGGVVTTPDDLVRANFTVANLGNRSTAGTLAWCLSDVNNDNAGLVNFVRGVNRYWKLGDINHSTPVVIGPPDGDSAYMGPGYAEFKETYAERPKVLYVGANDGMLHCFDVATGEELWGFVPYNLLPKLREMYAIDAANNTRYYKHDVYCDGSPAVADVLIGGNWRTVLITGQGPGVGSTLGGGLNYYWALDVTDPSNPLPLWEVSHTYRSGNRTYRTMGETWSTPAIGKANPGGVARWVAFMGSGYDNDTSNVVGDRFYAIRVDTGEVIRYTPQISQVDTSSMGGGRSAYQYTNIVATIPGSPTAVDVDRNGFLDYVYVGDLDGRLYRMDVTGTNAGQWSLSAIYTDNLYYPIITKPAVWVDPLEGGPARPRIYFGTGGDDAAPNDRDYSFVAVIDNGGNAVTEEWYLGVPAMLDLSATLQRGELGTGSKVWADPVIADQVVYFSTLRGSIEAVNPCINLGEGGRLYARYVRYTSAVPVGGTALKSVEGTPPEYLDLISKARRAVTVGEAERVGGRMNKREIYVQEYDSTLEKLEQPIGSLLRIKSWREIYRIIW